jgi:uroporphyrinogen-III decarboxylase
MTTRDPEELYQEREQRVRDAIQLKEPDRVPVVLGGAYFAARYAGVPASSMYYDIGAWKAAYKQTISDFEPDLHSENAGATGGHTLEALGTRQIRWPGYNLPPDAAYQFVEGEYMKEDEYKVFLSDPSDFFLRCYLPRTFGALEPLAKLPPLRSMFATSFAGITPLFGTPDFLKAAMALYQAAQAQQKWREEAMGFEEEMALLGFPAASHFGGLMGAPFDAISDFLRGMRGSMMDMFRHPDELLAACDKILEWQTANALPADPRKRGNPKRAFMALHRGSEGFMSIKQFEKFYWPGLKKAILKNINLGYVPTVFMEGKFDTRLEYLLELPKKSIICRFVDTDMARAKSVLGDHFCIMGNVPLSLLQIGSPSEVDEYCRNLVKICGRRGGFILTSGSSSINEAKPENVRAMVDSVKKY